MSELLFGPSADPLFIGKSNECFQPRLDGGFDALPRYKAGKYLLNEIVIIDVGPNQPSLFDEELEEVTTPELFD